MKLYQVKGSHSDRCAWLLEELGITHALVTIDMQKGEHKQPAYLQIHPGGQVPALVDGDEHVFESTAILNYLADKFIDRGFAPKPNEAQRGAYVSWLSYATIAIAGPVDYLYVQQFYVPPEHRNGAQIDASRAQLAARLSVVAERLQTHEHLLGERFSAADVALASVLVHAKKIPVELPASVNAYMDRVGKRPAFRKVFG
jgi:glutathione S-transferase